MIPLSNTFSTAAKSTKNVESFTAWNDTNRIRRFERMSFVWKLAEAFLFIDSRDENSISLIRRALS